MSPVILPAELERFAEEAVAAGRYRDVADVVQTGVNILRRVEAERAEFVASLHAAQADGKRNGFLTIDQAMADIDALIEDLAHARA